MYTVVWSAWAACGTNEATSFVVLQADRKNPQSIKTIVEEKLFKTKFVSSSIEIVDLFYQIGKRHAVFIQPVIGKA